MENIKWLEPSLTWFGHASFSFIDRGGNRIYYVDPFDLKLTEFAKADLVFITHAHPDHFSPNDLAKIVKEDTVIIAPPDILAQIDRDAELKLAVEPNKSYEVKSARHASQGDAGGGFKFQTVPAYNNHPDKLNFHPQDKHWVGYIFALNGQKIYHAGDTDFIDEMKNLQALHLDVAMLPIGGHYTMDVEEAARAANAIAAKITIPIHYRRMNQNYQELEEKFRRLVTTSEVLVLEEVA
ncbi:MAG: MBL fold metallo-hydrolase [Candidatus Levyibacteriota bacterium]|jgi:L-ascorbate metabolism protein UlaG (beta-lactamase superfamily)